MNTKKMLAILAALSMLGTTGLTVGAEDTAATEPAVETVVTTEAEAETAVSEIAETRTETTAVDEAKMEVNETTITEETAITTTIVQSEEPTSTTTAVKSDADGVETTVAVTGTESASVTTTTTYSAEETSKIMEELQKQIDNLIDEINHNSTAIIAKYIEEHKGSALAGLYMAGVIRKMERFGDHCTNIAEELIFYLDAKVMKHMGKTEQ